MLFYTTLLIRVTEVLMHDKLAVNCSIPMLLIDNIDIHSLKEDLRNTYKFNITMVLLMIKMFVMQSLKSWKVVKMHLRRGKRNTVTRTARTFTNHCFV